MDDRKEVYRGEELERDVPTEDLTKLEGLAYAFFEKVLEDYKAMMDKIHPTTTEYRIVKY